MTTDQVCQHLHCTPAALNSWLSRHPTFKPVGRDGPRWIWTQAEIDALASEYAATQAKNRNKPRAARRMHSFELQPYD